MTKEEILKGIEAYAVQRQEILDAICAAGGKMHQDAFDDEFAFDKHPWTIAKWSPGDDLGANQWLDLLFSMVDVGEVERVSRSPNVYYCVPTPSA
ncbi:MAG: hypothetical protein L0Z53_03950 [Acidobacteriales bacterium]|nr:hypothetical protein [Terriglobales bacterium]